MPNPEGYRKALRLMHTADRFDIPVVTLVDTPGAYPGLGAEERGQAEAIALNLREMARLGVPVVTVTSTLPMVVGTLFVDVFPQPRLASMILTLLGLVPVTRAWSAEGFEEVEVWSE